MSYLAGEDRDEECRVSISGCVARFYRSRADRLSWQARYLNPNYVAGRTFAIESVVAGDEVPFRLLDGYGLT